MKKIKYFSILLGAFIFLLFGAATLDCSRINHSLLARFSELDSELKKLELKYISTLSALSLDVTPLHPLIFEYQQSHTPKERFNNFDTLVNRVSSLLSSEINSQSARRTIDELHGVLNRREIIKPEYEKAKATLESYEGFCTIF